MSREPTSLRTALALASLVGVTAFTAACEKKQDPAPAVASAASASAALVPGPSPLRRMIWTERCPAETKYVDCMVASCGAVYQQCYGREVESGRLSGPCKEYGECSLGCLGIEREEDRGTCGLSCMDKHRREGSACEECASKLFDCSMKGACTPPNDGCP